MIAGERGRLARTNMDTPASPGLQAVAAADEGGAKGEGEVEEQRDEHDHNGVPVPDSTGVPDGRDPEPRTAEKGQHMEAGISHRIRVKHLIVGDHMRHCLLVQRCR